MLRLVATMMATVLLLGLTPRGQDSGAAESATTRALAAIVRNRAALRAFFTAMPKGADLHNHLDGAVDAERYVDWAARDGLCYDSSFALSPPPCPPGRVVRPDDAALRKELIDAFTMRDFVPSSGESGHDHFFATFAKFGPAVSNHSGDVLIDAARHAGDDRLDYVEFMVSVHEELRNLAPPLASVSNSDDDARILAAVRPGIPAAVRHASLRFAAMDADRAKLCAQRRDDLACRPTVRYIIEVVRTLPYKEVVAQTAVAFALAQSDPDVVGVNMVAPEDDPVTLATYRRQMELIAHLRDPAHPVHVTLHAGELTVGLVPREDLRDHIRTAVTIAGAERVGHGVDITSEDDSAELLRRMARDHVLVEVALSSNDLILGVRGDAHPLPLYLAAHVPVALVTDDEGVSRIDLTNEFVRAEADYHLNYRAVKTIVRNSLEYSFAQGTSLWRNHDYAHPIAVCAALVEPAEPACRKELEASLKMRLQYRLERELNAFESSYV
ncbi:MAG: hypothetical protein WAJ85_09875 [Candidatus Baltobacteraceae bacterium]